MSSTPPPDDRLAIRRLLVLGTSGSLLSATAATVVGALPVSDLIGAWPDPAGRGNAEWAAMIAAYLGLTLITGAWWRLGVLLRRSRLPVSVPVRALILWAAPLALAPPLYSRDVYSYLAQGTMFSIGVDPYRVGPAALGGPLAENVSAMWQHTPAPYGPAFLAVASTVTSASGPHLVMAVLGMRLVMIAALAMTVACVIPLAVRFGIDPASAVWLGAVNPLVLAHVVSGAHNDILMLMLISAGMLLSVRGRPITAATVLGLAVLVKVPAAAAVVVVAPAMARRLHGRARLWRGGSVVAATALATVLVVTASMGTWYGWVAALTDTARVRNGLSISTDVGLLIQGLAELAGAPVPFDLVAVARTLGVAAAAALSWWVLRHSRGRPLQALGLIMSGVVVLGPVVHPWYLLWGIVPLAASTRDRRVLTSAAALSVALAFYPMPSGGGPTASVVWALPGVAAGLLVLHLTRTDARVAALLGARVGARLGARVEARSTVPEAGQAGSKASPSGLATTTV